MDESMWPTGPNSAMLNGRRWSKGPTASLLNSKQIHTTHTHHSQTLPSSTWHQFPHIHTYVRQNLGCSSCLSFLPSLRSSASLLHVFIPAFVQVYPYLKWSFAQAYFCLSVFHGVHSVWSMDYTNSFYGLCKTHTLHIRHDIQSNWLMFKFETLQISDSATPNACLILKTYSIFFIAFFVYESLNE